MQPKMLYAVVCYPSRPGGKEPHNARLDSAIVFGQRIREQAPSVFTELILCEPSVDSLMTAANFLGGAFFPARTVFAPINTEDLFFAQIKIDCNAELHRYNKDAASGTAPIAALLNIFKGQACEASVHAHIREYFTNGLRQMFEQIPTGRTAILFMTQLMVQLTVWSISGVELPASFTHIQPLQAAMLEQNTNAEGARYIMVHAEPFRISDLSPISVA